MTRALETKLRRIRLRCALNVLLTRAAVVLAIAGGVAAAAVLSERLFSVTVVQLWSIGILAGAMALLIAGLTWLRVPDRMQVAVLVDRRLSFRERFSTSLAIADSDDPFAAAARREAHQAAERLNVKGRFPIRPSGHWLATLAAWLVAAGVFAFMPEVDVLGYMARRKADQAKAARLKQAKDEVVEATTKVKAAVQQVNSKQLVSDLADLGELTKGLKPADVRREAIRKLGALADKLKEMEKSEQVQAGNQLNKMLKGLRSSPSALDNELNRALANGDFAGAAKMLRDMMDKLNSDKLSEEQKKALAEQIKDLAKQLAELGDKQRQQEEALQREGMDAQSAKQLAGMSEQELREALKQRGMSDQQVDELMEKLKAAQQACENCAGLGKSLAECLGEKGELLPDGMIGLIEGLEGMQLDEAERAGLEEALKEIDRAIALIGEKGCDGEDGGIGLWQQGNNNQVGKGKGGGRARAWGQRPVGEPEDTAVTKTGVKNTPTKDAEIIASWLFKGPQAKGVSKRKLTNTVRAAKDAAAEAIRDNRIPRKYEGPVKKYFGGFDKTFSQDANQP